MIVMSFTVHCDVCRLWLSPSGRAVGDLADVLDFRTEEIARLTAGVNGWSTSGEMDRCPGCVQRALGCASTDTHLRSLWEGPPTDWWHEALPCPTCRGALVWRPVVDESP